METRQKTEEERCGELLEYKCKAPGQLVTGPWKMNFRFYSPKWMKKGWAKKVGISLKTRISHIFSLPFTAKKMSPAVLNQCSDILSWKPLSVCFVHSITLQHCCHQGHGDPSGAQLNAQFLKVLCCVLAAASRCLEIPQTLFLCKYLGEKVIIPNNL